LRLWRTIGKYLIRLVIVLFFVTLGAFLLIRALPGDPVKALYPFGNKNVIDEARRELGLNTPWYQQYFTWLGRLFTGDLGKSFSPQEDVTSILARSLPVSLLLMLYAEILTLVISVPLAIYAAYKEGGIADRIINLLSFGFLAIPNFVLAFYLILIFAVNLHWLPTQAPPNGPPSLFSDPVEHFRNMLLPTISLAAGQIAIYMRLLRTDLIATLREGFIDTARSKGISDRRVLIRHALRPSSLTLLTVAGVNVGGLIGGTVVLDVLFHLNGFGQQISASIVGSQYVELQSLIVVLALFYVVLNFVVDVMYSVLDPRVRRV
jgi:peptide/nickel transport system permease protein